MSDLAQETLELLKSRSANIMLKQIAADLKLSKEWLYKFHQGSVDGKYKPSEAKIKELHQYLVSKKSI